MATGDLKNNLKQFQSQVKAIKYPSALDLEGLKNGSPKAYLPLYHYLFTTYSNKFNKDIVNSNNELYGKSDLRFMEAVYKIMRVMFSHKPAITREQFFSTGFAERKLIMATEIFRLIHSHYKPQKTSSSFKFAAHVEKSTVETANVVHQDITEPTKPRKIALRSPPNMSGAVVLPRSYSGSNLIKPPHRVPVPVSASELSPSDSRHERLSTTPRSEHSMQEVERRQDQSSNSSSEMTAEMTKKMADQLTHSVIFLNEKIGKMALAIQSQEQKIENNIVNKPEPTEPTPASDTLMTNLSKQMNDIMFKLETLSSRVVLLENRMIMMEAKVDDTQSLCRTVVAIRNRPQSELQSISDFWLHRNFSDNGRNVETRTDDTARQDEATRKRGQQETTRSGQQVVREFTPSEEKTLQKGTHEEKSLRYEPKTICDNTDMGDENADESIIEVIGIEQEDVAASNTNMAFMKSLINNNSMLSNMTSEDCTLTEHPEDQTGLKDNPEQHLESRPCVDKQPSELPPETSEPVDKIRLPNTFGDFFSPIRSFSSATAHNANTSFQDSSAISIPYAADDEEENTRRFSTPNKASLDTSTISRVSRITQMLTATEQLFK